jgi:uncharacterized protein YecE (DUF72 family)
MEFGKLPDISQVNFAMPPSDIGTEKLLQNLQGISQKTEFFVGCPVWACKEWIGGIYPKNITEKQYLHHYTRQFNTIELNTTHYRTPDDMTVAKWKEQSHKGFKFCPKLLQSITHEYALEAGEALRLTQIFLEQAAKLDEFLGVVFMQLPPYFTPQQFNKLVNFVEKLPINFPFAIEFRHEAWFIPQREVTPFEKVAQLLESKNISTVICDVAGRRDVLHQRLTTDTLVLRFVGNGLHPTDYERTDKWIARIAEWQKLGLQKAYLFIHEPSAIKAPEMAAYWIKELNKHCQAQLKEPHFYTSPWQQTSLF